jgi:beta-galactosidase
MGSLPAYLLGKEGIVLRDYNEVYLNYVKQWYDKIIPQIANYQLGKQGTVIAVQLENELDFYDCKQYEPYIVALRDYAMEAGIEVPVFACAGQCDILRAGGLVEGVLPTINLYPEAKEKEVEKRIRHYVENFRERNLPLCITETGSRHFILRRELLSGAKLIAPYNQVGGTNFGFTTAVNNWGKPLSYLPHDYDLGGMISPRGELTEEYKEAFLFTGLVHSLDEEIALSWPEEEKELQVTTECKLSGSIHQKLCLPGGGKLIGFANIDDTPGEIHFTYRDKIRPAYTQFIVNPAHCPILPFELPLGTLGIDEPGSLLYSTAELGSITREEESSYVMFYSDAASEYAFELPSTVKIDAHGMSYVREEGLTIFTSQADAMGTATIEFKDGKQLYIKALSRAEAINQLSANCSTPVLESEEPTELVNQLQNLVYLKYRISEMGRELGAGEVYTGDCCKTMEELQYYRGYGWYEGFVSGAVSDKILGYMIYNGMDIVHLYRNGEYISSYIGDGTHQFVPEKENCHLEEIRLGVRCEIWGHSNFSDSRFPAMDIRSKKGIRGLAVINQIEEISEDWYYIKDEKPENRCTLLSEKDWYRPRIKFGSYNSPEQPQLGVYKKKIRPNKESNALILILTGLGSQGRIYIDGALVKTLQPFDSSVSLDLYIGKEEFELAIYYEQKTIQESGELKLWLYEGHQVKDVSCCGANEKQLASYIEERHAVIADENIVTHLQGEKLIPGTMTLYSSSFNISLPPSKSLKFSVSGRDAKLLVMLNGKMIGRLWLPSKHERPIFKGGNETTLYLPKSFLGTENHLDLLVEAMMDEPELAEVLFEEV